jgi:hypothetical protein
MLMCFSSVYAQKFVVYGDTRDEPGIHGQNLTKIGQENPDFVVHVGDMASGTSTWTAQFKTPVIANSVVNALWNQNRLLVCWGGDSHDGTESWMTGLTPPLVRNNSVKYTYTTADGKVFVIVGGYKLEGASDIPWLKTQLQSAAAKAAKWRVLVTHALIWFNDSKSGRSVSNPTVVRAICDSLHVDLFFCGHEHYFQRSKLMQNSNVLQSGDKFTGTMGTVANVVGNGATAFYNPGTAASFWQVQNYNAHGYSLVTYTDTSVTVIHKTTTGTVLDQYTWTRKSGTTATLSAAMAAGAGFTLLSCGNNRYTIAGATNGRYMVVAANGQILRQRAIGSAGTTLDLGSLGHGIYFVKVSGSNGSLTRMVMVQ